MNMVKGSGVVVGIYGVQGVGKSHVLKQIAGERIEWRVVDGSQLIREVLEAQDLTMEHFERVMSPSEKDIVRRAAIESAKEKPGVTLVAGHCSFVSTVGSDGTIAYNDVFTPADGAVYDMIVYLEKSSETVYDQVRTDSTRTRPVFSVEVIRAWASHEKALLESKCAEHGIAFEAYDLSDDETHDFRGLIRLVVEKAAVPACRSARLKSEHALVSSIKADVPAADVYLLIDGDGTLCPQDTGTIFFSQLDLDDGTTQPLKMIFKRHDHYTFQAFWEVAMLYSLVHSRSSDQYALLCQEIGREQVRVYEAWRTFLDDLPSNVHPIIVSSSIREVWLAVLEQYGETSGVGKMSVIAGNTLTHPYIVDTQAKALVAKTLRKLHGGCRIISFGDSAIDVPMICESDDAFIVVDEKMNRTMNGFISHEVRSGRHCRLKQIVDLRPGARAKNCHPGLAVGSLGSLLGDLQTGSINSVTACTSYSASAEILATRMRDSTLQGPSLQRVHEEVGTLLADKLLDEFGTTMGLLDTSEFPHVQGGVFEGMRTSTSNIAILPLMRGGEPMARGVFARFPSSIFIHLHDEGDASRGSDGTLKETLKTFDSTKPAIIILVDSVINTGRSIERALNNIQRVAKSLQLGLELAVYVLSGVIQEGAAERLPLQLPRARFLSLRVSKNKYTGRGSTDTGNRLFGTLT